MMNAWRRAAALLACLMLPGLAWAHGSVSMEKDVCKLAAGPYLMHFTGYQPERTRAEFCEDIPNTGRTVIVLDILDDVVRDMPLQVKFVRAEDGPPATAPALFSSKVRTYPTGSVAVQYTFAREGNYVGVVTLGSPPVYVAKFPFAVGRSRMWLHLMLGGVGLLALAGIVFFVGTAQRRRAIATAAARESLA